MARLDTCVTVVDAAEFHNNLDSMKHFDNGEMQGLCNEYLNISMNIFSRV